MKTSIKTLIATSLTAIVLATSSLCSSASTLQPEPVKTSAVNNFRRITIKGNIEVTLIQRSTPGVTYAEDNFGTARIMQDGDLLKITSLDNEITKVVIYVNDIYRIEASDNAVVNTAGRLNAKYLQLFLKGNAHAAINCSTEGLYTVIKDHADLKLSGSTDSHTLIMSSTPKLTIERFAALKTNISSIETLALEEEIAARK
ncbi:GIN domain-containing protein [Pedobacter sandarakinus]|uniref:GIN domain-containing protein n=1 Tax=Pedobacter sandarakinus TaxID=353156 RepID=UPI0022464852|nr:DUF2807 domain-containing protein [Pedobacter sandarakinus]MCX2574987.1 DUF2807 domain-containing protein [Pedobacter sandarakinus]